MDDDDDDEKLCVVCLERERDVMLLPCNHAVLCGKCKPAVLAKLGNTCPLCRQRVSKTVMHIDLL